MEMGIIDYSYAYGRGVWEGVVMMGGEFRYLKTENSSVQYFKARSNPYFVCVRLSVRFDSFVPSAPEMII